MGEKLSEVAEVIALRCVIDGIGMRVADESADAGKCQACALIEQLQVGPLVFAAERRRKIQRLVNCG